MTAPYWLQSFFAKLPWKFVSASIERRRFLKMKRKARRKQDGLASQLEDLEVRIMLSGTTAVNDLAILNQVNVPITLDVLANDHSANGELEIISASLSGASGSVSIISGDPNESGPASRDRIQVTLTSNFSGNASVQYTIRDEQGNQSSATATVSMSSNPGTAFTSSSGGAMSVVGGTGGGHVATPTSQYIPTLSGNYTYQVAASGVEYNLGNSSGTQSISATVTTTSNGVAVWSYTEHVVWSYDVTSSDGNGNTEHLWGNYVYTFSSSSTSAGVITTTLAYVGTDNFQNTIVTNTAETSFTTHISGFSITTISIINVDDVLDSGTLYYHKHDEATSIGQGTYTKAIADGVISGTMTSSSLDINTMTMSKGYTQLTIGGFAVAGTVSMTGSGTKDFNYSGSGEYTEGGSCPFSAIGVAEF